MGTRGMMGLVIDGQEKIGYNHWDSYPSGLGLEVLKDLRSLVQDLEHLKLQARNLALVTDEQPPTASEIEALLGNADLDVSTGATTEWYVLLRNTHGKFADTLNVGYIEDHHQFALDSLFCEYGYIVDLDEGTFGVYKGFQLERPTAGRWAGLPTDIEEALADEELKQRFESGQLNEGSYKYHLANRYYAVNLEKSWPLDALPTEEEFLAALEPQEEPAEA